MKELDFHHSIPVQIRWKDWDRFCHINNATYFEFFDTGKINYFEKVCPGVDWSKCAVMMVHDETDFVSQIKEFNNISVRTGVTKLGHKSITLCQEVYNHRNGEIKARCISVMVYYNSIDQKAEGIPAEWRKAISSLEADNLNNYNQQT